MAGGAPATEQFLSPGVKVLLANEAGWAHLEPGGGALIFSTRGVVGTGYEWAVGVPAYQSSYSGEWMHDIYGVKAGGKELHHFDFWWERERNSHHIFGNGVVLPFPITSVQVGPATKQFKSHEAVFVDTAGNYVIFTTEEAAVVLGPTSELALANHAGCMKTAALRSMSYLRDRYAIRQFPEEAYDEAYDGAAEPRWGPRDEHAYFLRWPFVADRQVHGNWILYDRDTETERHATSAELQAFCDSEAAKAGLFMIPGFGVEK